MNNHVTGFRFSAILCILFITIPQFATAQGSPPVAAVIPRADTLHGDIRIDNYAWLKDKSDPKVISYLEAENVFADAMMEGTVALQETIFAEIKRRVKETDLDVPYPLAGYFYYSRTEAGKQYPIYCRKKGSLDAPEEVFLDQNEIAKGHSFLSIGALAVSPDQHLLAYSLDTNGSEEYTMFVKDLRTGAHLPDRIQNTVSVVWATDNATIFYTTRDAAARPYRLYRHRLGADVSADPLLFEEKDELFALDASRTKSNAFILLSSSSGNSDEVRYVRADRPEEKFRILMKREPEHEYSVDHHGDEFFILTNRGARNFRIMAVPVADPDILNWREVVPHRSDVTVEGMQMFLNHFILFERSRGLQQMRVADFRSGETHYIEFPEPVYSAFASVNRVYETGIFRFSYQSFTTPSSIYDYNLETRERVLMKQTEVLGGYDGSLYQSERLYAKAPDGAEVPISLVYKKGVKLDGTSPLHLTGYGAYGISIPITFSIPRLSLLDRGVIYAMAHPRGGGDLGRDWKDNGKLLKKKNTFTDFIACAEHLIAGTYTSPRHLTIEGGSAGGLLVGAVTVMRPDLFKAVVAQVPFVDIINTMLDASLPLTVGEYLEWGNPNEKEYYDYMKSYCPYTNVKAQSYPDILVRSSINDPRVGYWEGAKWVAKLRAMKTDANTIILKVNMGAGHGGSSGRYNRWKEMAFDYAYILAEHGIKR